MSDEILSRQQRRFQERQRIKAETRQPQKHSRRRPDPLADLIPEAQAYLMTGPKAQPPTIRASRKMARYLLASPLHRFAMRHERGSWRSWERNIGASNVEAA